MNFHADDRRTFVGGLFDNQVPGSLNVVYLLPGALCAWHRHQKQDDYLYVAHGTVKVGLTDGMGLGVRWVYLSDREPGELMIPRNVWHGYMNVGPETATLVGYTTQKYDPTDEERLSPAVMGYHWEREAK